MDKAEEKFIIIGGIPRPAGGVTSFIRRLLIRDHKKILFVIDLYFGRKESIGSLIDHKVRKFGSRWLLFPWLLYGFFRYQKNPFFFNFSTTRSIIIFSLMLKPHGADWRLMLHHGNLLMPNNKVGLVVLKKALSKFNVIYALSSSQEMYYKIVTGPYTTSIRRTKSYVPVITERINDNAIEMACQLKNKHGKIFVMSGYPVEIYNYDKVLPVFSDQLRVLEGCLVIFIYGKGGLRKELRHASQFSPNIYLFEDQNEHYFNSFLRNVDCLLRLTSTDSFGICVADAISMGVQVLASDVSERFPGAYLVDINDEALNLKRIITDFPDWAHLNVSLADEGSYVFSLN